MFVVGCRSYSSTFHTHGHSPITSVFNTCCLAARAIQPLRHLASNVTYTSQERYFSWSQPFQLPLMQCCFERGACCSMLCAQSLEQTRRTRLCTAIVRHQADQERTRSFVLFWLSGMSSSHGIICHASRWIVSLVRRMHVQR